MPNNSSLVTPNSNCVPCQKEELCAKMAAALVNVGHAYMLSGSWRDSRLEAWNTLLDNFGGRAKELLAAPGDSWPEADAPAELSEVDHRRQWFRDCAVNFEAMVDRLPEDQRAEAFKQGQDALNRAAVAITGGVAPPATGGGMGSSPDGAAPAGA